MQDITRAFIFCFYILFNSKFWFLYTNSVFYIFNFLYKTLEDDGKGQGKVQSVLKPEVEYPVSWKVFTEVLEIVEVVHLMQNM